MIDSLNNPESDQILLNNKNDNNEKTSYGIDEILFFIILDVVLWHF